MKKFRRYPPRNPIKNYFPLPNELFLLGLTAGEIAIYAFLMRWENRKDYTCVESYQEIGDAVSMSRNTVSKYVAMLEERGLIRTEHTSIITRAGQKGNGKLRYKILPIQEAVDYYHELSTPIRNCKKTPKKYCNFLAGGGNKIKRFLAEKEC